MAANARRTGRRVTNRHGFVPASADCPVRYGRANRGSGLGEHRVHRRGKVVVNLEVARGRYRCVPSPCSCRCAPASAALLPPTRSRGTAACRRRTVRPGRVTCSRSAISCSTLGRGLKHSHSCLGRQRQMKTASMVPPYSASRRCISSWTRFRSSMVRWRRRIPGCLVRDHDAVAGPAQPCDGVETPGNRPPVVGAANGAGERLVDDTVPVEDDEAQPPAPAARASTSDPYNDASFNGSESSRP